MKVITVIPAYNKATMIADIVGETKKYCDDVVVVDDGSSDETPRIIEKLSVKYILHNKNYGAGQATKNGIRAALYHKADIVVTLDSDGQHKPSDIPRLLASFVNGTDVVIGSRFWGENEIVYHECYGDDYNYMKVPHYRRVGIDAITWLYNIWSKQRVSDSQCCFRAFRRRVLQDIEITEAGFGFSTEMLIKARKLGFKIVEIPIGCIYHEDRKQNSTLNPFRHGLEVAWKTMLWRIKLRN